MEQMKLHTLNDVLEKIRESFNSFELETETIGIDHAIDRYIAEDIIAKEDLPAFNRSNVDGFAIISGDTLGESGGRRSIFTQIGESEAGTECKLILGVDECVYVSSGAMIPPNADAVAHIEDCEIIGPLEVAIEGPIERWENVVRKGGDFANGEILLSKGNKIGIGEIAALAGAGINHIKVFKKLSASLISTGEELVESFNSSLKPGQSRDINSFTLSVALKKLGVSAANMGITKGNARIMEDTLSKSLENSDLVIITGGSSTGKKDDAHNVIKRIEGIEIIADSIGIAPGSGTIIGKVENKIIFGLPGNPASAMLTLHLLVKPFIMFINKSFKENFVVTARCQRSYKSRTKKEEYLLVSLESDGNEYSVTSINGRAGYITSLLNTDGFIRLRSSEDGLKEGQSVEVSLF